MKQMSNTDAVWRVYLVEWSYADCSCIMRLFKNRLNDAETDETCSLRGTEKPPLFQSPCKSNRRRRLSKQKILHALASGWLTGINMKAGENFNKGKNIGYILSSQRNEKKQQTLPRQQLVFHTAYHAGL